MLTYTSGPVQLVTPTCPNAYTKNYRPDPTVCTEFEVEKTTLPPGASHTLSSVDAGAIIVVIEGSGTATTLSPLETVLNGMYVTSPDTTRPAMGAEETQALSKGMVYFQSANTSTSIANTGAADIQLFRAHVNLACVGMTKVISNSGSRVSNSGSRSLESRSFESTARKEHSIFTLEAKSGDSGI
jgi:hypothetical protein